MPASFANTFLSSWLTMHSSPSGAPPSNLSETRPRTHRTPSKPTMLASTRSLVPTLYMVYSSYGANCLTSPEKTGEPNSHESFI